MLSASGSHANDSWAGATRARSILIFFGRQQRRTPQPWPAGSPSCLRRNWDRSRTRPPPRGWWGLPSWPVPNTGVMPLAGSTRDVVGPLRARSATRPGARRWPASAPRIPRPGRDRAQAGADTPPVSTPLRCGQGWPLWPGWRDRPPRQRRTNFIGGPWMSWKPVARPWSQIHLQVWLAQMRVRRRGPTISIRGMECTPYDMDRYPKRLGLRRRFVLRGLRQGSGGGRSVYGRRALPERSAGLCGLSADSPRCRIFDFVAARGPPRHLRRGDGERSTGWSFNPAPRCRLSPAARRCGRPAFARSISRGFLVTAPAGRYKCGAPFGLIFTAR